MVIGLNHRTAPVAVRERYWISENRRLEALTQLSQAEGIEEIVVLGTCNRTEFFLWASDPTLAVNSVLRFLTAEYGLKLCEWKHFYRLLDEMAVLHIFRVVSSLDSMVLGEPQIVSQVKNAWAQAQKAGSTGRFLDAVLQKALTVSKRVRNETAIGNSAVAVPYAAVELAKHVLGTLENKRVLVMGAGKMSELSARYLVNHGASSVCVINRTLEHAQELAATLGGSAARFEDRWEHLAADIVISSTSCPHYVLTRDEAESITSQRGSRPLVLVDIALPRDVDPTVREIEATFLYDLDDLERVVAHNSGEREAAAIEAQKIVEDEAQGFRRQTFIGTRGADDRRAARAFGRDLPTGTGVFQARVRAVFQVPGCIIRGSCSAHYSQNCWLAGSRTQRVSGEGGTRADGRSGSSAVPP